MDTLELWEQEIVDKYDKSIKLAEEARIYNFYGDVELIDESVGILLFAAGWLSIPFIIGATVTKIENKKYEKRFSTALSNYEKLHEDDKDFIKGSEFKIKKYDLKPLSKELGKEHDYKADIKANPFMKLLYKLSEKKRGPIFKKIEDRYKNNPDYVGKAMVFTIDNNVYFYAAYDQEYYYGYNASVTTSSVDFFGTTELSKKYKDYYMVYACYCLGFTNNNIETWVSKYEYIDKEK